MFCGLVFIAILLVTGIKNENVEYILCEYFQLTFTKKCKGKLTKQMILDYFLMPFL